MAIDYFLLLAAEELAAREKDASRDCSDGATGCSGGVGDAAAGCEASSASDNVPSSSKESTAGDGKDSKTGLLNVDSTTNKGGLSAVVAAANRQKFTKMLPVGLPANRPVDITANGPTRVPLSQRRNPPAKLNLTLDLSVSAMNSTNLKLELTVSFINNRYSNIIH